MSRSSCTIVASGGIDLKDRYVARSAHATRVVCEDAEYLGFKISETPRTIRLVHCRGYVRDDRSFERRQKWEVVDIDKRRLRRPAVQPLLTDREFESIYAGPQRLAA